MVLNIRISCPWVGGRSLVFWGIIFIKWRAIVWVPGQNNTTTGSWQCADKTFGVSAIFCCDYTQCNPCNSVITHCNQCNSATNNTFPSISKLVKLELYYDGESIVGGIHLSGEFYSWQNEVVHTSFITEDTKVKCTNITTKFKLKVFTKVIRMPSKEAWVC
jgi:hypothetical protein